MNQVLWRTSLAALILSFAAAPSIAAMTPDSHEEQDVAKKLSNPVADMVSVPLQYNWINGNGPQHDLRFVMNLHPVVPIALNEKWNLIGRWIMPYVSQPANLGSASGIGDIAGGFGVFLEIPSGGPEWQLRTAFTLVLPKK